MNPLDLRDSIVPKTLTRIQIFTGVREDVLEQQVNEWSTCTGNLIVSASAPAANRSGGVSLTVVFIPALEIADAKEVVHAKEAKDLTRHSPRAGDAAAVDGRLS